MMNPLLVAATRAGALCPPFRMASLKSSTALPNHILMTRKLVKPIMKPSSPIHAVARCMPGLSIAPPSLAPSLERNAVSEKRMKKMIVKPRAIAMNAGVVAVGALSKVGADDGSADRSVKRSNDFRCHCDEKNTRAYHSAERPLPVGKRRLHHCSGVNTNQGRRRTDWGRPRHLH